MYFGGEIVTAEECNYQTSRELGLICPFCNSAVFIRSESVRQVGGKLVMIRPYFAHYPSGTPDNWDCEKRSRSKQGREEIERLKITARHQRLRLYNAHLWDMIASDRDISHQSLNRVRSTFGERWCEHQSLLVRREWGLSITSVYTYIDDVMMEIQDSADKKKRVVAGAAREKHEHSPEEHAEYLMVCDRRVHRAICYEIADFLSTNSSGFAFIKIFKACLSMLMGMGKMRPSEIKKIDPRSYILLISGLLAGTHWIEQINARLSEENEQRSL